MHRTPRFHLVLSRPSLHNLNCAISAFHARLRVTTEDLSTSQPSKQLPNTPCVCGQYTHQLLTFALCVEWVYVCEMRESRIAQFAIRAFWYKAAPRGAPSCPGTTTLSTTSSSVTPSGQEGNFADTSNGSPS